MNYFLPVLIILLFLSSSAFSQDSIDYSHQKDLKDILKDLFGKKSRKNLDTLISQDISNKVSLSILPGISYNPATDVIFGVSASASWFMGDRKTTTNSAVTSGVSYTTKNQFKVSLQSNIFTDKNNWSIQGDWRFWKYSQDTYGLGTGTLPDAKQNMRFNLIRINQNFLRKIVKNLYGGLGYSLEFYWDIKTIDTDDKIIYPSIHTEYSKLHGFDSSKYLSSGIVLEVNYDSRDNTVNTYKGMMLDMKYYNYNKIFGSTSNWQSYSYEARFYKSVTKNNSIRAALWLLGTIVLNGNIPYMSLSSNGWDKYNASGRGYIQGRFRGRDFLYSDFETRFDVTSNGLIGLVLSVNATTTSDPDANVKLFDFIEPAGGVGLRIKFDKYSRTNISVDFGFGRHGSKGVFLTLGEFF